MFSGNIADLINEAAHQDKDRINPSLNSEIIDKISNNKSE